METTRFILFIALGLVLTMLWQAWQEDYGTIDKPPDAVVVAGESGAGRQPAPAEDMPAVQTIPPDPDGSDYGPAAAAGDKPDSAGSITVKTDVFDLEISLLGGSVQRLALLDYPVSKKRPGKPVVLLQKQPGFFYMVQGGLLSKGETANHKTVFSAERSEYILGDETRITIPLTWNSPAGLTIIKTYTFYKAQYVVDVRYAVMNSSASDWSGSAYGQLNRTGPQENGSRLIYTYTGAVISSPEKRYEKVDFNDIRDGRLSVDIKNGWAAMLQHYFITALLPGAEEDLYHYYTLHPGKSSFVIGAITPPKTVAAGDEGRFNYRVYFGPKTQKELKKLADGLDLTVDYGIFWFIAKPLFWVLDYINLFTDNWGWSIILVTLLLKILFYKLSAAGYRSMANMRRVQPRLLSIRERYKNDKPRLNQAMMDIYKEEKINPLGGCFPILVQIPVFISLYWVLLESVELRQADFMLWINDLSIPDPYFVLPLLMGITMFVQQKLNPAPLDPIQEKVMSILPVVFTVFFAFFPAGLVLYWVVNNILSIAQQWAITRSIEKSGLNNK